VSAAAASPEAAASPDPLLLLALLPPPQAIREIAMTAVNKVAIILFFIIKSSLMINSRFRSKACFSSIGCASLVLARDTFYV
jgi:hypothetical protein